jgi:colanic acid/amylovoran biosynthesis protein
VLIEIKGVQFENKGAELMLLAVLERLRREWPALEFALAPNPNADFRRIAGAGGWQRLRLDGAQIDLDAWSYGLPERLLALGRRHGIVTEADVDAVLDASGFAYGSAWGNRPMQVTARDIRRLARRGKPFIFLPQAFGTFAADAVTQDFGAALRQAALIFAREEESRSHLAALAEDLGGRIEVFPDFTMGLAGDPEAARCHGVDRGTALLVPNQHMMSEMNLDPAWRSAYLPLLERMGRELARRGWRLRVLNHEGRMDIEACGRLAESLHAGPVIAEADALALKGTIGAAGLVVCSRYHGCVSALSQGVPCIGTAWSHKYQALFDDFGAGEFLLSDCDEAGALERIAQLHEERESLARRLAKGREQLTARSEAMWQRVIATLGGGRGH